MQTCTRSAPHLCPVSTKIKISWHIYVKFQIYNFMGGGDAILKLLHIDRHTDRLENSDGGDNTQS